MSETDWHKIQSKLEGKCVTCGGELPKHIGVCPVEGEQLKKKYDSLDKAVKKIDEIAQEIIKKYEKNV